MLVAIVCAFTGLCYAELASMIPIAGSAYTYTYATMGELVAWIIGWDLILEYAVSNMAVCVGFAAHIVDFMDWFGVHPTARWISPAFLPSGLSDLQGNTIYPPGWHLGFNWPASIIVMLLTVILLRGIRESAETNNVRGEPYANGHVADRVLENEVPAYDPGDEFTHRSVRVGVRAAGNRNHGGQFGVANRCESAHDRHQDEGQRDGWSGSGTSEGSRMVNQIFEQGRVKNGFYLEFLAGDRCANDGENSRPNHGADSKRSEAEPAQRLLQSNFGVLGIRHQLVDALAAEEG